MKRLFTCIAIVSFVGCGAADDDDPIVINNANNQNNVNSVNNSNNANNGNNSNNANNVNNGVCSDSDNDGWFVDCTDYAGIDGPDCDDNDADNWESCATCVDSDGDGHFVGCDAFSIVAGPDCNDAEALAFTGAEEVQGNGIDEDCDPGTPDECTYIPVPASNPEPGFLAGITAEHNRWRWRVGVPMMTWNPQLSASATAYAEQCIWEHDPNRSPDAGFGYVGENLYATSVQPSNASVLASIESWADERYDWDWATGQAFGVVGHYTQLIWDDSVEVGCGYARCNAPVGLTFAATITVCRYGPGGNYQGQSPYENQVGACLDLDNDDAWQSVDADDTNRDVQ